MTTVLTLNAGSSSVKFAVFTSDRSGLAEIASGQVEKIGLDGRLAITRGTERSAHPVDAPDHDTAIRAIFDALSGTLSHATVSVVGHRFVHGGTEFAAPMALGDGALQALEGLNRLAPLHQPFNIAGVVAARRACPDALHVASFDTAFHRSQDFTNQAFALPRRFYDEGVRRYGFHGLSYQSIADVLKKDHPELARGRVIVAHLGNGSSMCAMKACRSVASSMGFSALDGLPMGTRCGQIDPGVLIYLLEQGMTRGALTDLLYRESGLKGLSGLTHDMRDLLASDAPEAEEAVGYFCARIRREIGAMAAVLGGVDGLVFTAGIGEKAAPIRARSTEGLGFLGIELDAQANERHGPLISAGRVPVLVLPTDEETVLARDALAVLAEARR